MVSFMLLMIKLLRFYPNLKNDFYQNAKLRAVYAVHLNRDCHAIYFTFAHQVMSKAVFADQGLKFSS